MRKFNLNFICRNAAVLSKAIAKCPKAIRKCVSSESNTTNASSSSGVIDRNNNMFSYVWPLLALAAGQFAVKKMLVSVRLDLVRFFFLHFLR